MAPPKKQPPTVKGTLATWASSADQTMRELVGQKPLTPAEKEELEAEKTWMKTLPLLTDGTILEIKESLKKLKKLRDKPQLHKKNPAIIPALRDKEIREIAFLILTDKNNDPIYCNWTMVTGMVLVAIIAAILVAALVLPPVAIVVGAVLGAVIGVGAKRLAAHNRRYWCCMFTEPPQMNNEEAQKTVLKRAPAAK